MNSGPRTKQLYGKRRKESRDALEIIKIRLYREPYGSEIQIQNCSRKSTAHWRMRRKRNEIASLTDNYGRPWMRARSKNRRRLISFLGTRPDNFFSERKWKPGERTLHFLQPSQIAAEKYSTHDFSGCIPHFVVMFR